MGCGTLAALGLTAAGGVTGAVASSEEAKNMQRATEDQVAKQMAFSKRDQGLFNNSLAQSTQPAMQGQLQQGQAEINNATKAATLTPLSASLPGDAASQAQNVSSSNQAAKNTLLQGANANLQGYGNIGLQQHLKDMDTAGQMGIVGSEAQNSASLFPSMLSSAANSEGGLAALGKLLSAAGLVTGLGSSAGLFGAGTSGVDTALATPQLSLDAAYAPAASSVAAVPGWGSQIALPAGASGWNAGFGFNPGLWQ